MLASAADRFPGLRRCSAGMQVDECRSMAHLDWDEFAASATQQYVCGNDGNDADWFHWRERIPNFILKLHIKRTCVCEASKKLDFTLFNTRLYYKIIKRWWIHATELIFYRLQKAKVNSKEVTIIACFRFDISSVLSFRTMVNITPLLWRFRSVGAVYNCYYWRNLAYSQEIFYRPIHEWMNECTLL